MRKIRKIASGYLAILVLMCGNLPVNAQETSSLCMGSHWTEDEANPIMKQFASEWHDLASWEKRSEVIRQGIISGMQLEKMPPVAGNFNPVIHNTREMDGYIVENIAIESFPGFFITGNLYRPLRAEDKNPAVLCPHGHAKDKRFSGAVQKRSASLARMGAIVFAYDMVGYGESHQVTHHIPLALLLQTWNSQRVLEYLISRPDVDAERIGITGGSGGATQSFLLAAIDDRIRVSVPAVQVSAHFFGGCVCESGMPIHKSDHHQTNNVEIAALCAPRPMLLISDGADWTRNTPRIEYPYIRKVYALYDAEHRVENVHLPSEIHDYGYSKRVAAYNFLAHHLGLNYRAMPYDNGYRETFVSLLSIDQLSVFGPEHPLPEHALKGDDAVIEYLDIHNPDYPEPETFRWTRFRGSPGDGIDTALPAPESWESSDLRWKVTLPGKGNASPVVWGNTIFVTSANDSANLGYVLAVDQRDGKILWQKEFVVNDLQMHNDNALAMPTPSVDESHLYAIWYSSEKTTLIALSHDGDLRWQAIFGGIQARHGGGSSLVLTGNNVVFTREQEEGSSVISSWVAVDKRTGSTAWELERETSSRNSFSTPVLAESGPGTEQLIFTSQAHGFTGVDPVTGQVLWGKKDLLPHRTVASPVYSEGLVIGCRKGEGVVLEVDLNTNQAADSARYVLPPNLSPYVPTPIVVDGLLFLFLDNGTVACVRFDTGELLWKERPAGAIYGSPVCVGGNLYCITKAGKVIVIHAGATYRLLGIHDLGEGSFSTPVMTGSGMVFRTFSQLMLQPCN